MPIERARAGWHLGERGSWRKMTVFELATRVPLAVHVPWLTRGHGQRSSQLVEMIDILPTLCELLRIPLPPNQTYDGVSLLPVLNQSDPTLTPPRGTGKNSSFSQYARSFWSKHPPGQAPPANTSLYWVHDEAAGGNRSTFFAMGHSVREQRWRYTEWVRWDGHADAPAWDLPLLGRELYDHSNDVIGDFDAYEGENLESDPAYAEVVARLSGALRYFFRVAECKKTLCSPSEVAIARAAQGLDP